MRNEVAAIPCTVGKIHQACNNTPFLQPPRQNWALGVSALFMMS